MLLVFLLRGGVDFTPQRRSSAFRNKEVYESCAYIVLLQIERNFIHGDG